MKVEGVSWISPQITPWTLALVARAVDWIFASLLRGSIENAVDLDDVVVEQSAGLEHGARRIGALAPQLGLHLVDQRCHLGEVADIDGEPHAVAERRALRLGDQPDVEEGLADAALGVGHQLVGGGIDALHAGDEDEVAGPGSQVPGTLGLDGAGWVEGAHAVG